MSAKESLINGLWQDHEALVNKKQKLEGYINNLDLTEEEKEEYERELEKAENQIYEIEEEIINANQ